MLPKNVHYFCYYWLGHTHARHTFHQNRKHFVVVVELGAEMLYDVLIANSCQLLNTHANGLQLAENKYKKSPQIVGGLGGTKAPDAPGIFSTCLVRSSR